MRKEVLAQLASQLFSTRIELQSNLEELNKTLASSQDIQASNTTEVEAKILRLKEVIKDAFSKEEAEANNIRQYLTPEGLRKEHEVLSKENESYSVTATDELVRVINNSRKQFTI